MHSYFLWDSVLGSSFYRCGDLRPSLLNTDKSAGTRWQEVLGDPTWPGPIGSQRRGCRTVVLIKRTETADFPDPPACGGGQAKNSQILPERSSSFSSANTPTSVVAFERTAA